MIAARRPGRPKKDEAEDIQAITWNDLVCFHADEDRPNQLQKRFDDESCRGLNRSPPNGKWRAFAKGSLATLETAVEVGKVYPETLRWRRLWLWRLLRNPAPPLPDIYDELFKIRPSLVRHVVAKDPDLPRLYRAHRLSNLATIDSLWKQGDMDALTALFALIRIAEYKDDEELYAEAAWAAMHVYFYRATYPPLAFSVPRVFDFLKRRFFSRVYSSGVTLPLAAAADPALYVDQLGQTIGYVQGQAMSVGISFDRARIAYWVFQFGLEKTHRQARRAYPNIYKTYGSPKHPCHLTRLLDILAQNERDTPRRRTGILPQLQPADKARRNNSTRAGRRKSPYPNGYVGSLKAYSWSVNHHSDFVREMAEVTARGKTKNKNA